MLHAARQLPSWLIFDVGRKIEILFVMFFKTAITALSFVSCGAAEISLNGMMSGKKGTLFAFSVDGSTPRWIGTNDTIAGMTVDSYSLEKDTVVLRKGSDLLVVSLSSPVIRHADNGGIARTDAEAKRAKTETELNFIYALALAGDEEIEDLVSLWSKSIANGKALFQEVEKARDLFSRVPTPANHNLVADCQLRLSLHSSKQNLLKQHLLEVSALRKQLPFKGVAVRLAE